MRHSIKANHNLRFGLPNMIVEASEKRAFLPNTIAQMARYGAQIMLEHGYGMKMGLTVDDYLKVAPNLTFGSHEDVYQQDYILVLRCPGDDDLRQLHPGACLISMLHYNTRPRRTDLLHSLGIEAISLDSIKDDTGRRLVENLRSVALNGVEAAFDLLEKIYPHGLDNPNRPPVHVTLMGSGAVGIHVVQAAIRYGHPGKWYQRASKGIPGVQVSVVDYDVTRMQAVMLDMLARTDILIDATQRPDPSKPVIPNEWIAIMPAHAVLLDLSVDPYSCQPDETGMITVKGIEGIPQGNLDQYQFSPDDPAYDLIPDCIKTTHRRHAVSCYSWPGVHPRECMQLYGYQLNPLLRTIIEKGGTHQINPKGRYFERAISRSMLSLWIKDKYSDQ